MPWEQAGLPIAFWYLGTGWGFPLPLVSHCRTSTSTAWLSPDDVNGTCSELETLQWWKTDARFGSFGLLLLLCFAFLGLFKLDSSLAG